MIATLVNFLWNGRSSVLFFSMNDRCFCLCFRGPQRICDDHVSGAERPLLSACLRRGLHALWKEKGDKIRIRSHRCGPLNKHITVGLTTNAFFISFSFRVKIIVGPFSLRGHSCSNYAINPPLLLLFFLNITWAETELMTLTVPLSTRKKSQ